ncbi:MAG: CoA transferase [Deltaproteobacteria bacterium]|nr:CoA transferase [Deltaproteobacteria bacterium]
MPGVLEGVKIVELGMWAAGPAAGGIMADWGAEVIKIEDPEGGDPFRGFLSTGVGATSASSINGSFDSDNRNKKSLALDVRSKDGQEVAYRLIKDADVFLTNFRPAAIERYNMTYATLKGINPRLVYVWVTGYGPVGPEKERAAFDYAGFWARAGMMATIGEPGAPPPGQRPGMGDHSTSIAVVAATTGALLARQRTGVGQEVWVSLYRTGLWVNSMDVQTALLNRANIPRLSRTQMGNPLFNAYRAKDNKWFQLVNLQSDRHWPGFCKGVNRADLLADPRFVDAAARRENGPALIAILDDILVTKTRAEWGAIFDAEGVFWAPIQTVEDVINDPQAHANGSFVQVDHPSGQRIEMVATPIEFHSTPAQTRTCAPEVGQHTEAILLAAGYSWEDMAGLREKGVIG